MDKINSKDIIFTTASCKRKKCKKKNVVFIVVGILIIIFTLIIVVVVGFLISKDFVDALQIQKKNELARRRG